MEIMPSLIHGFTIALTPANLLFCFLGALIGTAIGVLPGLGPAATIALLLPVTYWLEPTPAIIMLAGIYYGSMYGGSTTAILLNIPGEASAVISCIDGYQMAKKGRAGSGAGNCGHWFLCGRYHWYYRSDSVCSSPCQVCPEVRTDGNLLSCGRGADARHNPFRWFARQRIDHGGPWPFSGSRGSGSHQR